VFVEYKQTLLIKPALVIIDSIQTVYRPEIGAAQGSVSQVRECAGLLMNIGHLTTAEAYGWLLIEEYPDRIPCVGWKDHSLTPDRPKPMYSIELGTGHSPFGLYIREFRKHPAERIHVINCEHVPDPERPAVLQRSFDHLTRLWEE